MAQQRSRYFAGNDVDGAPIYKDKRKDIAPATVNRYSASLVAVITWAIERRIAPKGYVHPCRSVERKPENNKKTRFLSDDERTRLLAACKASPWPRLYALVLLALTTGARKGELLGLTFFSPPRPRRAFPLWHPTHSESSRVYVERRSHFVTSSLLMPNTGFTWITGFCCPHRQESGG